MHCGIGSTNNNIFCLFLQGPMTTRYWKWQKRAWAYRENGCWWSIICLCR